MDETPEHPLAGNPYTDSDGVVDAVVFSADGSPMQTTEVLLDQLKCATLAFAFEQRTANLIAYSQLADATNEDRAEAQHQAWTRLGLEES